MARLKIACLVQCQAVRARGGRMMKGFVSPHGYDARLIEQVAGRPTAGMLVKTKRDVAGVPNSPVHGQVYDERP